MILLDDRGGSRGLEWGVGSGDILFTGLRTFVDIEMSSSESKSESLCILLTIAIVIVICLPPYLNASPQQPTQKIHLGRESPEPPPHNIDGIMAFTPATPLPSSKAAKRLSFESTGSPLFSPSAAARYAEQAEQWNHVFSS